MSSNDDPDSATVASMSRRKALRRLTIWERWLAHYFGRDVRMPAGHLRAWRRATRLRHVDIIWVDEVSAFYSYRVSPWSGLPEDVPY